MPFCRSILTKTRLVRVKSGTKNVVRKMSSGHTNSFILHADKRQGRLQASDCILRQSRRMSQNRIAQRRLPTAMTHTTSSTYSGFGMIQSRGRTTKPLNVSGRNMKRYCHQRTYRYQSKLGQQRFL